MLCSCSIAVHCPILPPNVPFLPHSHIVASAAVSLAVSSLCSQRRPPSLRQLHRECLCIIIRVVQIIIRVAQIVIFMETPMQCAIADQGLVSEWSYSNFRMIMSCRGQTNVVQIVPQTHLDFPNGRILRSQVDTTRLLPPTTTGCHNLDQLPIDRTWSRGPNKPLEK